MTDGKEISVYGKIVDDIMEKIESEKWKEGQKLPGERELCADYGVARGTLKAAFSELSRMGLIRQVRGSGTYVERRRQGVKSLEWMADELVTFLASLNMTEGEILSLGEEIILKKKHTIIRK